MSAAMLFITTTCAISAVTALILGGRGLLAAFLIELAVIWISMFYALWRNRTGLEFIGAPILTGSLVVVNLVVLLALVLGRRIAERRGADF
jgi:hypothetical protein